MKYQDGGTAFILIAFLLIIILSLAGCSVLSQDRVAAEFSHVSHPMQGFPFGPEHEEATLDIAQVTVHKQLSDKLYLDQSLGVRVSHPCDFYGDKYLYSARIGYTLWSK